MKTLNKKNLKRINSQILEYQVLNYMYQKNIDLGIDTEEGAYGSYCLRSSFVVSIDLYKEFGIALASEDFIVNKLLPHEQEYRYGKDEAYDQWQICKEKEEAAA